MLTGRTVHLGIVLAAILAAAGWSDLPADDRLQYLGDHTPEYFVEFLDVEIRNDTAYVSGITGLSIVDISDPSAPELIGRYDPVGSPYNRFFQSTFRYGYAYCAGRSEGISILDLSDPGLPILAGHYEEAGLSFEGVASYGTHLYTAAHGDGLKIYSIADPDTLFLVGELPDLTDARRLVLDPPRAFVADGAGGLAVVDVSDPAAPALVAAVATGGVAVDIAVTGDIACLAVGGSGLDIVDISSPEEPVLLSSVDTPGTALGVALEDSLAFVADWEGVQVARISDPSAPELAGWEDTPGRAMGIDAVGTDCVVADWFSTRLYRYGPTDDPDILLPPGPICLGTVEVGESADTVIVAANTGGASLLVEEVTTTNTDFTIEPDSFSIAPDGSQHLTISFYRSFETSTSTVFTFQSDDPDEGGLALNVEIDDQGLLQEGMPAPDFTLQDLNGLPHTLSDYQGSVVLLAFFASW